MSQHALYHIHRQNRLIKIRKPLFPDPCIRILDKISYVVGVLGPAFAAFQAYTIWSVQSAEGVSLVSWFAPAIFNIPLFLYGLAHRQKLMMLIYALWFFVNGAVVVGVLLF